MSMPGSSELILMVKREPVSLNGRKRKLAPERKEYPEGDQEKDDGGCRGVTRLVSTAPLAAPVRKCHYFIQRADEKIQVSVSDEVGLLTAQHGKSRDRSQREGQRDRGSGTAPR